MSSHILNILPPPQKIEYLSGELNLNRRGIGISGLGEDKIREQLGNPNFAKINDYINSSFSSHSISCNLVQSTRQRGEGYNLHISNRITISAASKSGIMNGFKTLSQIVDQFGDVLPCLDIVDFPDFETRGAMLDISRDRVPLQNELLKVIDLLSYWKVNHLQLYTEHTFAYQGHEAAWQNSSALTPDEVKELDQHCQKRGLDLTPNQNCFGHMERWLKHPEYESLAELTGEWDFNGVKKHGPFSLCPIDRKSYELVQDLLSQLLPNFNSKLVNIGCDETFDVGQGKSRQAVLDRGFPAVYYEFVRQIAGVVRKQGYRPMFWADMALSHSDSAGMIPEDMICLVWGYEPDSNFDEWCRLLAYSNLEFWICPGTSSWRSITGRTTERRTNIRRAAEMGVKYSAKGFLITDWGDLGHRQQFPISVRGLMDGAAAGWNSNKPCFESNSELLDWMDRFGDADLHLRKIGGKKVRGNTTYLKNASCLFNDLLSSLDYLPHPQDPSLWRDTLAQLDKLEEEFPYGSSFPWLWGDVEPEILHSHRVAKFAGKRALYKFGYPDAKKDELLSEIEAIIEEYRQLWTQCSRPGGLEDSCKWYEDIRDELAGGSQ